jgi:hypothetical protein
MTKTELLKKCARWVAENDWWDITDHLFELGYNCQEVANYVEDADDKGFEQTVVFKVESLPHTPFLHFHFAINYYGGRWDEVPQLSEVTPYVTTRYKYLKNWTDDD